MWIQRSWRCDSDGIHASGLPYGFDRLNKTVEHTGFVRACACFLLGERGDAVGFICGGTDLGTADIYGYNEAQVPIITQALLSGLGRYTEAFPVPSISSVPKILVRIPEICCN